jgi:methionine sulfoxide reductase heme-binding subunit
MARAIDLRYRWLYKPSLHIGCLAPLVLAIGGVLLASGADWVPRALTSDLGVDAVRRLLGIAGKTTLNLLLLTLLITPLRVLSGNAHLLRLRRTLGVYAFVYALLHFVVYVGLFQALQWSEIVKDLYKRWYIVLGFAALLMLLPLAITSTNAMMRRLKRRWASLHRLIYAIAFLGVCHYWIQTKKDLTQPRLYALALALLLGFRVWRHLRLHRSARLPQLREEPQAQRLGQV